MAYVLDPFYWYDQEVDKMIYITFYRTEFIQGVEELNDEVDGLPINCRVNNIQELCRFSNNVKRLHVIWLFSKIVLKENLHKNLDTKILDGTRKNSKSLHL